MSGMEIITTDVTLEELTDLFCRNQRLFYLHIGKYAATHSEDMSPVDHESKPLRVHRIESMIDCIYSPTKTWSFYNAILDTDICHTLQHHRAIDEGDHVLTSIVSLATRYRCPTRIQIKPNARDTEILVKRHGFFELPSKPDAFQYIDFHDATNPSQSVDLYPDVKIYELDDATQTDYQQRKADWGQVLCESFGFPNIDIYGTFYSKVWSQVAVGPTQPVRMFIAVVGDRVVGGSHLSLGAGVACLFNVTTVKDQRGKGIGKALSLVAMDCAKQCKYRYMLLQASDMGSPIYKKLGFRPLPAYKVYLKIGTIAWHFRILELFLRLFGVRRMQRCLKAVRRPSKTHLFVGLIVLVVSSTLSYFLFRGFQSK